ncbi:MAG: ParA family protein, partial [Rhodanobacter sp.]
LRSIIPRNVRLAEAPSHGQPIHLYDRSSRGAIAYIGLAGEVIRRERGLPRSGPVGPVDDIEPPAPAHGDSGPTLKAPAANHQE